MKYQDLTIHQRITLKGMMQEWPPLRPALMLWVLWDYVVAANWVLNDELPNPMYEYEPKLESNQPTGERRD